MAIVAILLGIAVAGLVIAGFVAYWLAMMVLIIIGGVFFIWLLLFLFMLNLQLIVAVLCAVIATGFTIWLFNAYSDKKKVSGDF